MLLNCAMMLSMTTTSAPRTARDRARAELIAEITSTARSHVAEHGASGLSLRAVSRDLGMASSALYRYFPSRDTLLTRLIVDAYDALGEACEEANAAVESDDLLGRWRAIAHATRDWARTNPHEYALIYGSPVPGYVAPTDTVDPATRVPVLLLGLLADLAESGVPAPAAPSQIATQLEGQLETLRGRPAPLDESRRLLHGISAWVGLFGMVNFELFGQFKTVFDDADELFAAQVDLMGQRIGLPV